MNNYDKSRQMAGEASGKLKGALSNSKLRFMLKNWKFIVMIIYNLSPVDIIPDPVPFFGQIDDVITILWSVSSLLDQYSQNGATGVAKQYVNYKIAAMTGMNPKLETTTTERVDTPDLHLDIEPLKENNHDDDAET